MIVPGPNGLSVWMGKYAALGSGSAVTFISGYKVPSRPRNIGPCVSEITILGSDEPVAVPGRLGSPTPGPIPFWPETRLDAESDELIMPRLLSFLGGNCPFAADGGDLSLGGDGPLLNSWRLVARRRSGAAFGSLFPEVGGAGASREVGVGAGGCGGRDLDVSDNKPAFGDPVAETGEAGFAIGSTVVDGGPTSPFRYSGVGGRLLSLRTGNSLRLIVVRGLSNLFLMLCTFELVLPIGISVSGVLALVAGRTLRPGNPTTGGRGGELCLGSSAGLDSTAVPEEALSTAV